jgi:CIC family chloride channel protein
MRHPEVCGNGYSVVNRVLQGDIIWESLLFILALKLVATAVTFGSGAVGGVFTPTLVVGACLGSLTGQAVQAVRPGPPLSPQAFAIVGMGALLAATTHAPIMAIIMVFELTLDYQIILPLMLACVVAHYTCFAFEQKSIYADSLKRKGSGHFRQQLEGLRVAALMKPNPVSIHENARFREIAENFVAHRFNYLYVTDAQGGFRGVISLHDIKNYLNDGDLAELVLARDISHAVDCCITPESSLTEALEGFVRHEGERLPVTVGGPTGALVGSISKTDVILALAERSKPE